MGSAPSSAAFPPAPLRRRNKPAPDIFLEAARLVGAQPEQCVVIEDAAAGIQAAKAAGMRVIGVTTTLSASKLSALAAAPDAIYTSLAGIQVEHLMALGFRTRQLN